MKSSIDVFCGLGALSLGFYKAGVTAKLAMDLELRAAKTFAANHPECAVLLGDCRKFAPGKLRELLGKVDGVIGGVPCEPFSRGRGQDASKTDPRRNLINYALTLIREFEPGFFCFENVWAAPESASWKRAAKVMERAGFGVSVWKLNAADFGVPQSRKRAFFVGVRGVKSDALSPPDFTTKKPRVVKEALANLDEPSESGRDSLHRPGPALTERVLSALREVKPGQSLMGHGSHKGPFTDVLVDPDAPARTVTVVGGMVHWNKKRWLTPRELARLQNIPDDYKFPVTLDQARQLMGDAVPVGLAHAVARRVVSFVSKAAVEIDVVKLDAALEALEEVVWTCDDVSKIEPNLQGQAERAARQNKVTVGEFFYQPKPTRPALAEQLQSVESLLSLYKEHAEEWLPAFVQKKYDGANHQAHVDGDKVVIISEDGEDNTDRLPGVVKELKALGVDKLVLPMEIEAWDGRQHLPREVAAAYLHSKDEPDDSNIVANVYDVVLHGDEKDVHKWPTTKRLKLLKKLGIKQSTMGAPNLRYRLNAALSVLADDLEELERAVRRIRKLPGSEGVVTKQADAPYPPKKITPDTWVKFHNATTLRGIVTGRERTEGGVWVYQYGVLPGKEQPVETVKVDGKEVVPVGDTFGTKLDFDVGDGILIEAETVNLERSLKGVRMTAWVPRVIRESGKPDTMDQAATRARENLVLQEKDVDEQGKITYRPVAKRAGKQTTASLLIEAGPPNEWSGGAARALGVDGRKRINALWNKLSGADKKRVHAAFEAQFEVSDIVSDLEERYGAVAKQQDPYMEIPDEGKMYRYSVQHHFRGRSLHADLRIELKPKELLIGWTMNTQVAGSVKEPVVTLAQARRLARDMNKISKINWNTGEWAERPKAGTDKLVRTEILCERKQVETYAWIDVEGKTKNPEPGKAPPVGGTRQFPGVFDIVDQGKVEYGAQKPWFHEYFFRGKGLRYRVFFRLLQLQKRDGGEDCEACKDAKVQKSLGWAGEPGETNLCDGCAREFLEKQGVVLPPSEEQELDDTAVWLAIYPDDAMPYAITDDAVKKDWMPPSGYSALPEAVRKQVPPKLQYWEKQGEAARKLRDELVRNIVDGEVKIDPAAAYKSTTEASMFDADFVLQEQSWRGPVQVRVGPTRTRWWVRLDVGRPELLVIELRRNPLDNREVAARVSSDSHKESLELIGDIKPGHYLNPTKETPSVIEMLDRGKAEVISLLDDRIKVRFKGGKLSGIYVVKRNNSEYLWSPVGTAPKTKTEVEKQVDFELFIPIHKVEVKKAADGKEKRLVTGIALEPNVVDAQGQFVTREVIEKAAHNFLREYNKSTEIGVMHKVFGNVGIELVESFIAPVAYTLDSKSVKEGSWVVTVHVSSDTRWKDIKDGKLTGFSVGGAATVKG